MNKYLHSFFESDFTWPELSSGESVSLILIVFFALLMVLEHNFPKDKVPSELRSQSYLTNMGLFAFNSMIFSLLPAASLLMLADYYSGNGILSQVTNPIWMAIASFLVLDLTIYLWHRVCHSFDFLWMFHKVHHSDRYLNTSTAFRVHFTELFITFFIKAAYIIFLGVDKTMVLINEAIMTFFVIFHHTNISSFTGEGLLGRVFIVPHHHRVHHSTQRHEHDRNYGSVLSLWDRLFGTLAELEPAEIGLKNQAPLNFINLLKFGFIPGTTQTVCSTAPSSSIQAMIAEAAYYKAEKRGFSQGSEVCDWLASEREINELMDNPISHIV